MKEMTTQLQKSFDQAGRSIEQSFVRPEVLLSAFAVQDGYDTLQRGCGVLDIGAETMTLTLYKGGQYLFNKVYPHGSHHLTDRAQLGSGCICNDSPGVYRSHNCILHLRSRNNTFPCGFCTENNIGIFI